MPRRNTPDDKEEGALSGRSTPASGPPTGEPIKYPAGFAEQLLK